MKSRKEFRVFLNEVCHFNSIMKFFCAKYSLEIYLIHAPRNTSTKYYVESHTKSSLSFNLRINQEMHFHTLVIIIFKDCRSNNKSNVIKSFS